jgi:hypothetical protein
MIQRYVLQQGLLLLSRLRMSYLYMNCEKLLWSSVRIVNIPMSNFDYKCCLLDAVLVSNFFGAHKYIIVHYVICSVCIGVFCVDYRK